MDDYEIAIILQAYNKGIIGMKNYVAIEKFSKMINWQKISTVYRIKKGFKSVAQKLVKRKLLSDDGKSMAVLYLDKIGASYIIGMNENEPKRISKILSKIE
ncbi:hypothetical protein [Nitrosopumilus ureiphilus]|uniref:Uncharacterized protein n=1 Tax=Nitrosopumilus ureiphilus TaxID=1470067 RepID=A0A7D5M4T5_9ARCH|nr:hypothetical protein [Nitrosopumilus ureiphilus]QLH07106.1 hypothetical protein C5F50_08500 [Nitrosopumilus ureiphilus]